VTPRQQDCDNQRGPSVFGEAAFLFAQRSWQTQSLLVSDLAPSTGKRIRFTRASLANGGV
ncbi:MAG TPA: hypothetical protein PLY87_28930, partial [Planctomycetaceae bacterium]|nr:hypothetical protein [Planctomycetaceae bacterium]